MLTYILGSILIMTFMNGCSENPQNIAQSSENSQNNAQSSEFDIQAKTAILQDFHSGKILFKKNPDLQIYPASMTKIMTSIIAFDLIKKNELTLDQKFIVSEKAWKYGGSKMFLTVDHKVEVKHLLKGVIITSGNDACIALAEGIAGTEDKFVILMNDTANELGMNNTNFSNSTGISNPNHYSTVRDILKMSRYLIKEHPELYKMFAEKEFTWNEIKQNNRNPLLYKDIGADGIKTGHTKQSRYSLASSIERNGRRLIAVGSGFDSKQSRSRESVKLLEYGIEKLDRLENQ